MANGNTNLPPFNKTLGGFQDLPANLAQKYQDVVTQVFPLRANKPELQRFCDTYLNLDEAGDEPPNQFKVAAPWVLMQICHYAQMSLEASNVRSFSQHELAFGFAVEWRDGSGVFKDWALVYPFIYVDNPISLAGGREVYGWSKRGVHVEPQLPQLEPNQLRCLVSIANETGLKAPADKRFSTFAQIYQQRPFLSGRSGVEELYSLVPRAIGGYFSAASGVLDAVGGIVRGQTDDFFQRLISVFNGEEENVRADVQSLRNVFRQVYGQLGAFVPASLGIWAPRGKKLTTAQTSAHQVKIITLKQFRDAASPTSACYQAIVPSQMSVDRMIDGGILFDPISGDPTGGIQIRILSAKDQPGINDQPIVEQLGLEHTATAIEGKEWAIVRPVIPFWMKADMSYRTAEQEYWRTDKTKWSSTAARGDEIKNRNIKYLLLGSGAKDALKTRVIERVKYHVFPLKAEKTTLQTLCNNYLKNKDFTFELLCPPGNRGFVYALVGGFEGSGTVVINLLNTGGLPAAQAAQNPKDNEIDINDRYVSFVVPVEVKDGGEHYAMALVPLFTFVGKECNSVTDNEVYGRFSVQSKFIVPGDETFDPASPTTLLTVETLLLPRKSDFLPKTLPIDPLKLVEIKATADTKPVGNLNKYLGIYDYFVRKPFKIIGLKQVRDAKLGDRAIYQSLVSVDSKFTRTAAPRVSQQAMSIEVASPPDFNLVKVMGLKATKADDMYLLDSTGPFIVEGKLAESDAKNMCWRAGSDLAWKR